MEIETIYNGGPKDKCEEKETSKSSSHSHSGKCNGFYKVCRFNFGSDWLKSNATETERLFWFYFLFILFFLLYSLCTLFTLAMVSFEHKIFYDKSLHNISLQFFVCYCCYWCRCRPGELILNLVSLSLSLFATHTRTYLHMHTKIVISGRFVFIFKADFKDTYFIRIFLKSNLVMGSMRCHFHSIATTTIAENSKRQQIKYIKIDSITLIW